jgi:hypothetical protein
MDRYTGQAVSISTYVGDDIDAQVSTLTASVPEKDYIAVYDKKMLWRANLYIDETRSAIAANGDQPAQEAVVDWNDVHPWNAPSSAAISSNQYPIWGKNAAGTAWDGVRWGYNEWNLVYNVLNHNLDHELVFELPTANIAGRQVIRFSDYAWTPVRTWTNVGEETNYINNTVAYDYHISTDGIRAWDSPFDFIFKMHEQRRAIRNYFSQFFNDSGELLSGETITSVFPSGIGNNEIGQPNVLPKVTLASWVSTMAAHNQWKFYWKETSNGIHAYIPGLGLRLYDTTGGGTTEAGTNTTQLFNSQGQLIAEPALGFTSKDSAGADCVGFAQRTASYNGNFYNWTAIGGGFPDDRAESYCNSGIATDPDDTSRTNRDSIPRHFDNGNKSSNILNRIGLSNLNSNVYFTQPAGGNGAPSLFIFNNVVRPSFLRIVPGDVIWYVGDHLGIVCEVDYEAMSIATSIYDLMRAVKVIETVYSGSVNYVHKRNMLQGGGANFTEVEGSWHRAYNLNDQIVLRNWYIERLSQ